MPPSSAAALSTCSRPIDLSQLHLIFRRQANASLAALPFDGFSFTIASALFVSLPARASAGELDRRFAAPSGGWIEQRRYEWISFTTDRESLWVEGKTKMGIAFQLGV